MSDYGSMSFGPGAKPVKYAVAGLLVFLLLCWLWPFYTVPTGFRGVVTTFGENNGLGNEGTGLAAALAKTDGLQYTCRAGRYRRRGRQHLRHPAGQGQHDGALLDQPGSGIGSV